MFAHYFSALVVVTWSNKLERSLTLSCYNCSAADEKTTLNSQPKTVMNNVLLKYSDSSHPMAEHNTKSRPKTSHHLNSSQFVV